jgi:hypothetical protein
MQWKMDLGLIRAGGIIEANVKTMEEKGLREVNTSLCRNKVCLNLPLVYTTSTSDMEDR